MQLMSYFNPIPQSSPELSAKISRRTCSDDWNRSSTALFFLIWKFINLIPDFSHRNIWFRSTKSHIWHRFLDCILLNAYNFHCYTSKKNINILYLFIAILFLLLNLTLPDINFLSNMKWVKCNSSMSSIVSIWYKECLYNCFKAKCLYNCFKFLIDFKC